jgi:hypothetical protein
MARVERSRNTADRTALACGVDALEHRDQRTVAKTPVAREQVEAALVFFEFICVGLFRQHLFVIEAVQQIAAVERRHRQRCRMCRWRPPAG